MHHRYCNVKGDDYLENASSEASVKPSSLVGAHRIHLDRSSIADEVSGCLNPGRSQDQPEEPLSSVFPGLDLDRELGDGFDADFGCELHESEDLEAARVFGLLD